MNWLLVKNAGKVLSAFILAYGIMSACLFVYKTTQDKPEAAEPTVIGKDYLIIDRY